jgi:hypothetical protein
MTSNITARLAAALGTLTVALALHQPVLAEEASAPAAEATAAEAQAAEAVAAPEPAAEAPAAAAPAAEPAEAARAAMEARRAEHMARMQAHQEAMRERAAAQGIDIPPPPAPPEPPQWLSYEEMQAMMKAQGIELPPLGAMDQPPEAGAEMPLMPPMPMGGMGPEEMQRVLDVIAAMTPEQQDACFAFSRWQAGAVMPRPRPPMGYGQRAVAPGYGPSRGPAYPPMRMPHR